MRTRPESDRNVARSALAAAALVVALGSVPAPALSPEARLLATEPAARVPLTSETVLEVHGFRGRMLFKPSPEPVVQFATRDASDRELERPVEVWVDGTRLVVRPLEGDTAPMHLELLIPEGLSVEASLDDVVADVVNLEGSVEIRAVQSEVNVSGTEGRVLVEATASDVTIRGTEGDVAVVGRDCELRTNGTRGGLSLELNACNAVVVQPAEALDTEIGEATDLVVEGAAARVEIVGQESRVKLAQCKSGALIDLESTPIELVETAGEIEIRTDAEVAFALHDGTLRVFGYGSNVRGTDARGPVEIETDGAMVVMETLAGPVRIRGQELDIRLKSTKGEVRIDVQFSNVVVEQSFDPVFVHNEMGDVEISEARQRVEVRSRDGNVRLQGLHAPLELEASGETVEVGWSSMSGAEESNVVNETGSLVVVFPVSVSARLRAEAPYGRIETDLEGVTVTEDGHFAAGLLNHARTAPHVKSPTVLLKSGGDLFLRSSR